MSASSLEVADLIKEGDFVFINGGGGQRIAEVKKGVHTRFGRSGSANISSLAGMRFGEVVRLDHATKKFVACDAYPDLDVTDVQDASAAETQVKDNRNLLDDNQNQLLTADEIAAIRAEKGIDVLLNELAENSTTYHTKTEFAKEKYLKKKQKKYGTLFKVDRITPDNMAEIHFPTVNPSDAQPEDARCLRLRGDTVALILHHGDVHDGSRVLCYDRTNGLLPAYLLTHLGDSGRVFQVLDKSTQPNLFPARQMGLTQCRERWTAIPRSPGFVTGVAEPAVPREARPDDAVRGDAKRRQRQEGSISQWIKGQEARELLLKEPVDSLIIADDEHPGRPLAELLPFLANGGHLVVYSPFLEDLSHLFLKIRNVCVNIRISETWYRHHQVLPQRTHPTVNMSTAAGYILTAVKVQANPNPRPRFANLPALTADVSHGDGSMTGKRPREEGGDEPGTADPITSSVASTEEPASNKKKKE